MIRMVMLHGTGRSLLRGGKAMFAIIGAVPIVFVMTATTYIDRRMWSNLDRCRSDILTV